jgi:hypothetical protein
VGEATSTQGQGHVDAVGHQVRVAVLEAQVDLHLGVVRHELQRQRDQHAAPEGHRAADAQLALHLGLAYLDHLVRLGHVVDDGLAFLVVQRAGLGQAHAARVAVEQAHLQPRLHGRDLLGHRGLGGGEFVRDLGEAARLHHAHEHVHGIQSVHGPVSSFIGSYSCVE